MTMLNSFKLGYCLLYLVLKCKNWVFIIYCFKEKAGTNKSSIKIINIKNERS